MTETPPTAPDPYDYAHPNPPDDTHLWDLYGVAQVLGLRYRTIAAGKRAMPYREKQIGRGQKTRFYSLESIIEWDKMRDTRLLDDEGRQRILTDTDGRTWVDGKRVYTIKDAAEYLDMTHDALRARIYRMKKLDADTYLPAYKVGNRYSYYTQEQIDTMKGER